MYKCIMLYLSSKKLGIDIEREILREIAQQSDGVSVLPWIPDIVTQFWYICEHCDTEWNIKMYYTE